jgi:hypothetical protein
MYTPGTILTLKEPREDDHPFNRVRVVNQSPMTHSDRTSEWVGSNGQGVIIQPAGEHFGPTEDVPYGRLNELYDIESVPPTQVIQQPVVNIVDASTLGPSPEEVFAKAAEDAGETEVRRARAPKPRKSPVG